MINFQFRDVLSWSEFSEVSQLSRSALEMSDIVISTERVFKLLKGLSLSKAMALDEFYSRILEELTVELFPVFPLLFQQSLDTDEIPKENICPLFTKGDWALATNYLSH